MKLNKRQPLIIKVGSSLLTDTKGHLDRKKLADLVRQIAALKKDGYRCILVTSGAIAAGLTKLGLKKRPSEIPKLQAAAAVGQGLLIQLYADLFAEANLAVGQILVTQFDMNHRELYLNAANTINQLLDFGVVPIVNENDTTAVQEIKFGDNDSLAAMVAVLAEAQLLIILSDVPGLYSQDPRTHKNAALIKEVAEITPEVEQMAAGVGSNFSVGGMATKIAAAKIVTAAQIGMIIAQGNKKEILQQIVKNNYVGTYFKPSKKKTASRKLWIGFGTIPKGQVIVDEGAAKAIASRGKSLLPAGVVAVKGSFDVGDTVDIVVKNSGTVFARGLTNYSSYELEKIKGKRSNQLVKLIGLSDFNEEVIHRDNLVVL